MSEREVAAAAAAGSTPWVREKYRFKPWFGHESTFLWDYGKTFSRIVTSKCFDLRVYGADHLPRRGGVLLVANHQSYLDPVLLCVKLKRPVSFMAKSELFDNPFFAWLIRNLHAFPVRQGAGDIGAVREAIARLKDGHVLLVFPEGSRSERGEMLPMQPGIGLMVRRAGVPVVPAVVDNSWRAWPKGSPLPQCTPIRVMFRPPMELEGLRAEAIVKKIDATLRTMLAELKAKPRDASTSPKHHRA